MLGSELWESKFNGLLALVKEYIVDGKQLRPLPWVRGQWQWCYGSNMSIIINIYIYIYFL